MSTSDNEDSNSEELSWISWFCGIEGHEFLVKVPKEFF